jgi:hypothetical protein
MIRHQLLLSAIVILWACDGTPFSPTVENMAGRYQATTLQVDSAGHVTDYIVIGSAITLDLNSAGTVTGHLLIVGGNENGSDMDADMAGTWALTGDTVTFDQTADTFVRDYVFTARRGRLHSEHRAAAAGATVTVEFTKRD